MKTRLFFGQNFTFRITHTIQKLCIAKCTVSLDRKVSYQQSSLTKFCEFSYKNAYSHSLCESFRDPVIGNQNQGDSHYDTFE